MIVIFIRYHLYFSGTHSNPENFTFQNDSIYRARFETEHNTNLMEMKFGSGASNAVIAIFGLLLII